VLLHFRVSVLTAFFVVACCKPSVKPENILVHTSTKNPHNVGVKLIDFGLCDFVDPTAVGEKTCTTFVGSLDFCAPEVIQCALRVEGVGAAYDGVKADSWPVGAILFECLFWKYPFLRDQRISALRAGLAQPSLRFPGECTDQFKDICCRLMDEDPGRRLSMDDAMEHPWARLSGPFFSRGVLE
jgi:calcium/calmodulin-dependent protein kinase kinase 2